jgi:hypothetical protein
MIPVNMRFNLVTFASKISIKTSNE